MLRSPAPVLAAALLAAACSPAENLKQTTVAFSAAVQDEDLDRLYCLCAGAATSTDLGPDERARREAFAPWARAEYERYLEGRDAGFVEMSGHGIALVKLFALGRGTFARFDYPVAAGQGAYTLRAELRFGYEALDLSAFSPGTTFYLTGVPVGTVHPVEVPRRYREVTLEVLDTLEVEWTLVPSPPSEGCPAGWAVASVIPVEGSARTAVLTWTF